MFTLNASMISLQKDKTHRFATCWKIERTDGEIFRFTDHNCKLTLSDGTEFTPAGGFNATASQKQSGLRAENKDVIGLLQSGAITHDDLRSGKYREAEITEMLVDWRYPWAGIFITNKYWIVETTFSEEHWEAKLEGVSRWLTPKVGGVYNRTCRYKLGDSDCGINLGALGTNKTVASVSDDRRVFCTSSLTEADDYFKYGYLLWTSGANDGLKSEIQSYELSTNEIKLYLRTSFDIETADTFTIYPGCDKISATCKDKFSNLNKFGGFPFIPGTDKMLNTPKGK